MLTVVEEVAQKGVTQEEVDRARQRILKNRELAAADPNRIAIELSEWSAQGDWRLYFLNRDRIEQVTPEQVKQVAASYFTTSNRTVGFFHPHQEGRENARSGGSRHRQARRRLRWPPDQSHRSETSDVSPLAIEARLSRPEPIGGMRLAFLPKKTRNESVHLRMSLHYGDAENLKGFTEAAGFLPELMTRGTKDLTVSKSRTCSTRTSSGSAPA